MIEREFVDTLPNPGWLWNHGARHLPRDLLVAAAAERPAERPGVDEVGWVYNKYAATPTQLRLFKQAKHASASAFPSYVVGVFATIAVFVSGGAILLGAPVLLPIALAVIAVGAFAKSAVSAARSRRIRKDPEAYFGADTSIRFASLLKRHQILARALWKAFCKSREQHPDLLDVLVPELWEGFALVRDRDLLIRAAPSTELLEGHPVIAELDSRVLGIVQRLSDPVTFSPEVTTAKTQAFHRLAEDVTSRMHARREVSRFLKE